MDPQALLKHINCCHTKQLFLDVINVKAILIGSSLYQIIEQN